MLAGAGNARTSGRLRPVNNIIDWTEEYTHSAYRSARKLLTRNNFVNRWIYIWLIGAATLFIPLTFIALRSGIGDDLGVRLVIDTANICDGPGRVHLFTGSQTCVEIRKNTNPPQTIPISRIPLAADRPRCSGMSRWRIAHWRANVAEIRLDATTTLAFSVLLLVAGIPVSMALWWSRNRKVREIEVL